MIYNKYSDYLKNTYGEKVYKIPINIPVTCPNRDGCISTGGCIFCGEEGTGFENLSNDISVKEQLKRNIAHIGEKYASNKYIAYFQNFTNTYLPLEKFKTYILESIVENVVEIAISTRPDCISDDYLIFIKEIGDKYGVKITIELGLQTVNYNTLKKINRGHTLAEYLDAVLRIKKYGFKICTHMILNLPWDDEADVCEAAKIISSLGIDFVKLHSLYIVKNTAMEEMYKNKEFEMISVDEYKRRVIMFLEYLSSEVVIQRLISRAPKQNTMFVNWYMSWWKIRDEIELEMKVGGNYQGRLCDYLGGKALKGMNLL
ncbi:MAG: TIGR01212 family radical SAM protein [Clostridiales bacterium GWE2_32_10]|nr:MAG: TIGR01212 family radical SAM protein [Clostridiales bacterium GWE2_32_10]HBY20153.1 TIGR01212 family radical SAM protein [Clostridiales bacterium]